MPGNNLERFRISAFSLVPSTTFWRTWFICKLWKVNVQKIRQLRFREIFVANKFARQGSFKSFYQTHTTFYRRSQWGLSRVWHPLRPVQSNVNLWTRQKYFLKGEVCFKFFQQLNQTPFYTNTIKWVLLIWYTGQWSWEGKNATPKFVSRGRGGGTLVPQKTLGGGNGGGFPSRCRGRRIPSVKGFCITLPSLVLRKRHH